MIAHLDYETRSAADLKAVGAHRYAIDPTFGIMMAAVGVELPEGRRLCLWVAPELRDTMAHESDEAEWLLAGATEIHAHNAPFEQACTWGALQQGKPCPLTVDDLTKWRCTAAVARTAGLPWSLDKLALALRLTDALGNPLHKDTAGAKLIRKFCTPAGDRFADPAQDLGELREFARYCRRDVEVEMAASECLQAFALHGGSLAAFQFDLRMNQRGIPVHLPAARNAQTVVEAVQTLAGTEFHRLTGLNPTQREKIRERVGLPNMQGDTVSAAIAAGGSHTAELKLYQALSFSAVKKVRTMLDSACPDGRVRGTFLYHGAGTGRWAARGIQPQNFRKTDPAYREQIDGIRAVLAGGTSAAALDELFGPPLECVANCIRGFIECPGDDLLDADYSAIEARILVWVAGQRDALARWARGSDSYKWMAAHIYGLPEAEITPDQREVGKRAILGAGYQMGPDKFRSSCLDLYGLDLPEELCGRAIASFRAQHPEVRALWYRLQDDARAAVESPGTRCGRFELRTLGGIPFLLMALPSGRRIAYPHPQVETERWLPKGETVPRLREQVTYWGQLPLTVQWGRVKLYGGKLTENLVQGIAADIMAHGAVAAEAQGVEPFMLVHDEALCAANGRSAADFAAALAAAPAWADGLPLKVEGKRMKFWKK